MMEHFRVLYLIEPCTQFWIPRGPCSAGPWQLGKSNSSFFEATIASIKRPMDSDRAAEDLQ